MVSVPPGAARKAPYVEQIVINVLSRSQKPSLSTSRCHLTSAGRNQGLPVYRNLVSNGMSSNAVLPSSSLPSILCPSLVPKKLARATPESLCGGAGFGMVYLGGSKHHRMDNDSMIDHIVEQVEKKAEELERERAAAVQAAE